MFGSRRTEAALAALQAENSDLRLQLRTERDQFAQERQQLLDRLLAVSVPNALREVRRAPTRGPGTTFDVPQQRRRLHYPGEGVPTMRPPDPPSLPTPGTTPLTDAQLRTIITSSDTFTSGDPS